MCEPVDRFELELPQEFLAPAAAVLGRLGAVTVESTTSGGWARLVGCLPSARVPSLSIPLTQILLPARARS